jgi:mono/diheme cytochrome c family protein
MKRTLLIFLIIGLFIACSVRKSEPITQKEFTPEGDRIANGQQVFMMQCQKCHPGGEAGLGPSVNGNIAPQFIKRFQMRHGIGVMPSFKPDEISRKNLRDVSKYLRAWKSY